MSTSSSAAHPAASAAALRAGLTGRVITAHDAEYDDVRTVFMGGFDRRPALIARPSTAADVAHTIKFAREQQLPLAVRCGGHSGAAHGVIDDGLVLDVRDLRSLEIDAADRSAWAGAGLSAGAYTKAVGAHGLATGFGDTGSVGIGGITLSGGIGYLVRQHGLTIDNLLAAEVVTADGEILHTDAATHPDLFWAIRGGGGNFGVATRFRYRLQPVDRVVGGLLLLPATPDVVAGIVAAADEAPEALSVIANVMPAPPMPFVPAEHHGQLVVMLLVCFAGDAEAGAAAMAPFRALATPLVDMVRPIRYPELFPPDDPSYHPTATSRTLFRDTFDRATAAMVIDALTQSNASMRAVQIRALGGAMARVPSNATAFAHRQRRLLVNVASFYTGPGDKPAREAWTVTLAQALREGDEGAYVAFLMDEGEARVRAAYPGETWRRLASIKARYDPSNVFRQNQNVAPVTSS